MPEDPQYENQDKMNILSIATEESRLSLELWFQL